VHCNVNGAHVYFDGTYEQEISGGVLTVPVYSTGTPLKSFTVSKSGCTPYTGPIPAMPGKGETFDVYATLNLATPTVPPTPAVIGGGQGWYVVNCKVNGATVSFDNPVVGTITQGTLSVPVYTTGTPYQTYTVSMNGNLPHTAALTSVPAPLQSVQLYATLNPGPPAIPTAVPTPVPTKSPLPFPLNVIGLGIAGIISIRTGRSCSLQLFFLFLKVALEKQAWTIQFTPRPWDFVISHSSGSFKAQRGKEFFRGNPSIIRYYIHALWRLWVWPPLYLKRERQPKGCTP
jgi:hypothetical protein